MKILLTGGGAVLGGLGYSVYVQWKNFKQQELQATNSTYQGVSLADAQTNFGFNNNTYNAQQLNYMQLPTIALNGRISEVIGKNVNANFQAVIYGEAGSGKSHLATIFTKDLGLVGRTLYVTAEEGLTNHVKERLKRHNVTDISNVEFLPSNDVKRVMEVLHRGNYQFVVIDSIQALSPDWKEQLKFTKALRKLNLLGSVLLLQVNKGGEARGSTEILHDADVVIEVSNGIAKATKNRFGESNSHEIFKPIGNGKGNILHLKVG
jgi:predicted ATP-dependent serine protease